MRWWYGFQENTNRADNSSDFQNAKCSCNADIFCLTPTLQSIPLCLFINQKCDCSWSLSFLDHLIPGVCQWFVHEHIKKPIKAAPWGGGGLLYCSHGSSQEMMITQKNVLLENSPFPSRKKGFGMKTRFDLRAEFSCPRERSFLRTTFSVSTFYAKTKYFSLN